MICDEPYWYEMNGWGYIRPTQFEMPHDGGPPDEDDVTERCWGAEKPALGTAIIP